MKFKFLLVVVLLQLGTSSLKAQNEERPNIVWIVSEDNSKHYLKLYDTTGAETPNIESLAKSGVVFNHAFSNTPVCSAARSTLISSSYGPRLATHYHRRMVKVPMPEGTDMFPAYLRKAGYYTANNAKEDYNISTSEGVWDKSSKKSTWRDRKPNQPFFYVHNIETTHESRLHFTEADVKAGTKTDASKMVIQPNHPQTDLFRYTHARYHDKMQEMDRQLGAVVAKLKADGLYENTFIFYYGDHGGVLPGSKGYINEMGVHVPLVVHIPTKFKDLVAVKAGTRNDAFVSFIDFGATVLNLAGVEVPKEMDGKPFLGKGVSAKNLAKRTETFSYTNRMDEKYDMVRAVRKGKYKYTRNYEPFNFDGLMNNYRYKQLGYQEWIKLYKEGKLNADQSKFFEPKQAEELYDVEKDPYELHNLAAKAEYKKIVKELRANLNKRIVSMPDLSFYPEFYLIKNAFENPVAFGQKHKKDIKTYLKTSNLMLLDFDKAKSKLQKALQANDPWVRYWALISASAFGTEAKELASEIKEIAKNDTELINKVRAAEFLGLSKTENPANSMTQALYDSRDGAEALLILNSIVLMQDCAMNYSFHLDKNKVHANVLEEPQVLRRLDYLNGQ
ncbi:sulfatase-like hydrolase/transferase [Flavicella sediminum]|uniref:sulfatase-like hydrolase/transferase n=1 Tax=Flavicella sediminum TaxID=2585141 RepID=UPI00111E9E11|nr:sulfatase-like hydrolase/transferase [Flavicella sediminum]